MQLVRGIEMQDRLKYRFWHKPTNKMMDCYGFNEHCTFANTLDGIGTEYNPCATKDCVLMQCTGMLDDNGKLIYEGDIVKIWKMCGNIRKRMIVKWRDTQCSFRLYDLSAMGATPQKLLSPEKRSMGAVTSIKILGNIYENPELLEV